MLGKRVAALSWSQISPLAARWSAPPGEAGPTSAQSRLRLFGAKESDVRVTLYRDNHAWWASANTMCTVEHALLLTSCTPPARDLRLVCDSRRQPALCRCPYCQKCWLWLEEKQVPYKVEKITMFCYGEKEAAYKRLVPNGMLPALSIDGERLRPRLTRRLRLSFEEPAPQPCNPAPQPCSPAPQPYNPAPALQPCARMRPCASRL